MAGPRDLLEEAAMRTVMVRYRVKPDRVAENEELVRAVYEELRLSAPEGLRYGTFKCEDGVTFVHIAEMEEGGNPLAELDAFKAFQAGIGERCEEQPASTQLSEVGSFHFFEGSR
jgi:hypothetical protein